MRFVFWVFAFFNSTTAFSNKLAPRTLKTFSRITSSKADVIDDVSVLNSKKIVELFHHWDLGSFRNY